MITNPVLIFFVVLIIILLAPLLLNRVNIPHVVGLIVAGVLVGPWGFNLLSRDSSFEIFGQVGLLYLMFLAGLEIDVNQLKKNIHR
ncbi:MAG: cation:proton antiporter, partial [Muribaculaceae bacterium]|nr:cation:proton antiporter [Muribaculaceae bacterium]